MEECEAYFVNSESENHQKRKSKMGKIELHNYIIGKRNRNNFKDNALYVKNFLVKLAFWVTSIPMQQRKKEVLKSLRNINLFIF